MPANYAFHRFGADALTRLPGALKQPLLRFRRLYNGGVHGPDLFFYHNALSATAVTALREESLHLSGRDFFAAACACLKDAPSEGGTAFLYGLLAHYCLCKHLAPVLSGQTQVTRTELEVELDRYLLSLDGKNPAHRQDISPEFKMTRGECVTASHFFPPATPRQVHACMKGMLFWTRRMAAKKRGFVKALLLPAREELRQQLMPEHADHRCIHLDEPMLAGYRNALEEFPELARQLTAYRTQGTPLGEAFAPAFL